MCATHSAAIDSPPAKTTTVQYRPDTSAGARRGATAHGGTLVNSMAGVMAVCFEETTDRRPGRAGDAEVPQPAAGANTRNFDHGIFPMS